ncbi:MAG: LysM peptidoglycan-binding domain-containing protein [Bdellovibrionaceae bacterium]|nr:LysM peptidoglycan-binding domain-containing protein [Pseudobdellovibrionaceae bacterium]
MIKFIFLSLFIVSCSYSPFSKTTLNPKSRKIVEQDLKDLPFGKIPVQINKYVLKWIYYYQGRGRKHMRRYLARSSRYQFLMQSLLKEDSVPIDLIYVPLIESGFTSHAYSHASAVGYWQFIRGTATSYGLRVDGYVDDRKDPVLSTKAAIKYFKTLHNMFGDWYLVLAAYNSGENRIKRYIKKYKVKEYWTFVRRKILPRETRNYVPKFLAALLIAKNPKMYGFHNIKYQKPFSSDYITVKKSISLKLLSKEMKISFSKLKKLNPRYLTDWVPVKKGSKIAVRVPTSLKSLAFKSLPKSYSNKPFLTFSYYFYYRVKKGDNLSYIAKKFRSRVSSLRRLNRLKRKNFLRIGQKLKIRRRTRVEHLGSNLIKRNKTTNKRAVSSIKKLRKRKKISTKRILRKRLAKLKKHRKIYKIKRGDTISHIAKKFRISIKKLKRKNRLSSNYKIFSGGYLIIPK